MSFIVNNAALILCLEFAHNHYMNQANYTCVNCQLPFPNEILYKEHYKSEHHRYNVKRKLIGLPPLNLHDYQTRYFFFIQNSKANSHQRVNPRMKFTVTFAPRSFCHLKHTNITSIPKSTKRNANICSTMIRVSPPLYHNSS